jgi:hypothetical protein
VVPQPADLQCCSATHHPDQPDHSEVSQAFVPPAGDGLQSSRRGRLTCTPRAEAEDAKGDFERHKRRQKTHFYSGKGARTPSRSAWTQERRGSC